MAKFSRRTVLKSMGLGGAAWTLGTTLMPHAKANPEGTQRNFIYCYFGGGWDILMGVNARDPNKFNETNMRTTRIQPAYDRLDSMIYTQGPIVPDGSKIDFGPAMAPITKHYDVACMVRGVNMDTVSHTVGALYANTGQMPRGQEAVGSSISTWFVAAQGEKSTIPNLAVGVRSFNRKSPAFATGLRVSNSGDLLSTLSNAEASVFHEKRKILGNLVEQYRQENENCDPGALNDDGLMDLIRTSQKGARVLVSQKLDKHFDFRSGRGPEIDRILNHYGNNNRLSNSGSQAAMAFQALKHNIAQSVSIRLAGGLDTHGSIQDNADRQMQGWAALSALIDDLKATPHPQLAGKTLMDTTTILCASEFSRTPMVNSRQGRDHWLASGMAMFGAGVPHNKVIGATTNKGFNPAPIDPIKGTVVESGGVLITPTLIATSILESAGFDTSMYRKTGLPALMNKA